MRFGPQVEHPIPRTCQTSIEIVKTEAVSGLFGGYSETGFPSQLSPARGKVTR